MTPQDLRGDAQTMADVKEENLRTPVTFPDMYLKRVLIHDTIVLLLGKLHDTGNCFQVDHETEMTRVCSGHSL